MADALSPQEEARAAAIDFGDESVRRKLGDLADTLEGRNGHLAPAFKDGTDMAAAEVIRALPAALDEREEEAARLRAQNERVAGWLNDWCALTEPATIEASLICGDSNCLDANDPMFEVHPPGANRRLHEAEEEVARLRLLLGRLLAVAEDACLPCPFPTHPLDVRCAPCRTIAEVRTALGSGTAVPRDTAADVERLLLREQLNKAWAETRAAGHAPSEPTAEDWEATGATRSESEWDEPEPGDWQVRVDASRMPAEHFDALFDLLAGAWHGWARARDGRDPSCSATGDQMILEAFAVPRDLAPSGGMSPEDRDAVRQWADATKEASDA
jgi:hypothetical protein